MDKKEIKRFVLDNAVNYDGKANSGSVISKILGKYPNLKSDVKTIILEINDLIKEVNSMSLDQQKDELSSLGGKFEKIEKEEKDKMPDLGNSKKIVVRFAPNPNGPISFGHCRPALWNWFLAKEYDGKYILRFDDTDPKVKPPIKEAYDWFKEDLAWLGIKPNKIVIQSKRLKLYYKYAQKLIDMNKAYVCTCDVEKKRNLLIKSLKCPCYDKYQTKRWKAMFDSYNEGEAVLRIKTDLKHPNPAIRDWAAFRIINEHNHPIDSKKNIFGKVNKSRVWPLLNFASAIDDHLLKTTHILRGIDLSISDERQKYLYDYFGWTYPKTLYHGKLLFSGVKSTSESKKLIESGELTGWDDPSLGTIKSLRRRGFQPESIIKFMKETGIKKGDIKVSMDTLAHFNKESIDSKVRRYFFIENPRKIKINNANELEISVPSHPDNIKLGYRIFRTYKNFYVSDEIKPGINYRFMHLFNFKDNKFISQEMDLKLKAKMIHWLPVSSNLIDVEILMEDSSIKKGLGESNLKDLKIGEIIQFERNFFARLEEKGEKYKFIFCHR
jgi:glutamyl-tRNA synthetase